MTQTTEVVPQILSGWGRTAPSRAGVCRPIDAASAEEVLRSGVGPVIARGMGRSYGDAAQCTGGLVIDTAGLSHIGPLDEETGTVEVGAGVSLQRLMQHSIPLGWFVAVTPGTRYISVGGAIAADIHGKNHHCDGSFARHVRAMTLATPSGTFTVTPNSDGELFWATAGAMGMTGVILQATLQLIPIETSWMSVDSQRFTGLADLMSTMEESDADYRYSVAWLDCLAHRSGARPSVLTRGDHATSAALSARRRARSRQVPGEPRIRVPRPLPGRLVNKVSVRALNEAWYRIFSATSGGLTPLTTFFHPLDGIGGWNLLYGPDGFVQYQFAVPPERADVVENVVEDIAASGIPSFLAVLKRFGKGTPGPLSFSQEGWTLALDFPLGPEGLPALLDRLDLMVADAGGRVYLAKDARLQPELLPKMYPHLGEMAAVCRRVDPAGVLQSDLSRRLGISG